MDEQSLLGLNPDADASARQRTITYFEHLKASADGWKLCVTSLFNKEYNQNDHIKFFCFQVIEDFLKTRYASCSGEDMAGIKQFLLSWIQQQSRSSSPDPLFLRNKLAQLFALAFLVDFPARWPSYFDELLQTLQLGVCATEYYLRIMLAIDTEVVDRNISHTQQEIDRNTQLKDDMRERCIVQLVDSWYHIITTYESSNTELVNLCLEVITAYISWIDINLIANERFVNALLRFMSSTSLREAACECIHGIIVKGMEPHEKLKLIESFMSVLLNIGIFNINSDNEEDIEYYCKLSKMVNGIVLQLIMAYQKLSKSKDSVGCRLVMDSLQCKLPLMLSFLSNDDDDVSGEVLKAAHDYISLLKVTVPNTPEQQKIVEELLKVVIKKMKFDEEYNFEQEGEEEAEFLEFRKDMKTLFNNIGALNKDLVLQAVFSKVNETLSTWRTQHVCELELAITLIYYLAEAVPLVYRQYMTPDEKYDTTMHNLLIILMTSGVLEHGHFTISLQLFETFNRYDHMFTLEPRFIQDVLIAMLDQRGLFHPSPRVASRTAYLFTRFIKRLNKSHLQSYIETILRRLQDLLELHTPFASHPPRHTLSNEDQQFLYETVGILIVHSQFDPQQKVTLMQQLLEPLMTKFSELRAVLASPPVSDVNSVQYKEHMDTQLLYCDAMVQAMALASRLSKGFSNHHTMHQCQCVSVYTNTLQLFLQGLETPVHRSVLHAAVRSFLHRMVVCMEQEILPYIPIALQYLLQGSGSGQLGDINAKELYDFVPLLNQLICKFKMTIVPFVHEKFRDIVGVIFNVLMQPIAENDRTACDDRKLLQRGYCSFIATIVNSNVTEILSKQEPTTINHVLTTMTQGAVDIPDPTTQKTCFTVLKGLVEEWGGKSIVEGFDDYIIHSILPTTFTAPMKDTFDMKDGQTVLVLNESASCLKAICDKQKDQVINYLQSEYLPSLNVSPQITYEFCEALKSDHKVFRSYYKQFFMKAKT